jgi:ankyrin repeat protein
MTVLAELPTELILHIVSFLTRERILDLGRRPPEPKLVSDLPSINALSRTNTILYPTLNQALYKLCASVPTLGLLAILFCVEYELESALDKLVTAGISVNTEVEINCVRFSLLHIAANRGLRVTVVKLLEMYGEEMAARVHARRGRRTALDYAAHRGDMDIVRILAPISMPSAVLDLNDAVVPGPDSDSDRE